MAQLPPPITGAIRSGSSSASDRPIDRPPTDHEDALFRSVSRRHSGLLAWVNLPRERGKSAIEESMPQSIRELIGAAGRAEHGRSAAFSADDSHGVSKCNNRNAADSNVKKGAAFAGAILLGHPVDRGLEGREVRERGRNGTVRSIGLWRFDRRMRRREREREREGREARRRGLSSPVALGRSGERQNAGSFSPRYLDMISFYTQTIT